MVKAAHAQPSGAKRLSLEHPAPVLAQQGRQLCVIHALSRLVERSLKRIDSGGVRPLVIWPWWR